MARDVKSVTEYWQELAKKHDIAPERANAILEVLKDDKAGKAFLEGFVPQSDYSRDLDKTRDEWKGKLTEAEKKVLGYDDWYKGARATFDANVVQAQATEAKLKQYTDTFGALDDSGGNPKLPPDIVTRKDLEDMARGISGNTASVLKALTHAASDHMHKFGQPLDVDAFEKFMIDNNLAPKDAYERYVAPKMEEKRNVEFEAKLKTAKEEAVRDYASKHQMPVDTAPREHSPFFDRKEMPKDGTELQQERNSRNVFLESLRHPAETKTA